MLSRKALLLAAAALFPNASRRRHGIAGRKESGLLWREARPTGAWGLVFLFSHLGVSGSCSGVRNAPLYLVYRWNSPRGVFLNVETVFPIRQILEDTFS